MTPEPDDLAPALLRPLLGQRPVRRIAGALDSAARRWADEGAADGAVLVGDHAGLQFALVLRPRLPLARAGWLYTVASSGVADALGGDATIVWPDRVRRADSVSVVSVTTHAHHGVLLWAVVRAAVPAANAPRGLLLGRILAAIEHRQGSAAAAVLDDYLPRCGVIGRILHARPRSGPPVVGRVVDVLDDGAVVLEVLFGHRVALRPADVLAVHLP